MHFDARVAAKLPSGEQMTFEQFPGLRLQTSASRKSWTYRYKSPVDGRMRQIKLGEGPAMAFAAAIAGWETNRVERDSGGNYLRCTESANKLQPAHRQRTTPPKGAVEVARIFKAMLGPIADLRAATITRAQAFDFLDSYRSTPVLAGRLRMELSCAWHYALDAGQPAGITGFRMLVQPFSSSL
ncbi:hypothetical protein M3A49_13725 [Paraburkholderia sp. CNPSo 3076]|uniref:hypothetical protein n=1 Tax=Paraburkholderia sp. CNPSo 3076 TaxID=2940936 RepID=UPI002252E7AB|nr:hypothetical protein [Paraburkholderia sp. CNPSo 3076]MCX5540540.1 hypothetical protein [Paraburkholderia sp. CNPSo 3076]